MPPFRFTWLLKSYELPLAASRLLHPAQSVGPRFVFCHLSLAAWLCLCLWLGTTTTANAASAQLASQQTPGDFVVDIWQTEQGLPQNHVTSILQSREGYLWIGTYEGLARFDGVRFVTFHAAHEPGLSSSRITSLFEDDNGVLWIGHEHGQISRFTKRHFETVSLGPQTPRVSIAALGADSAGDVWFLRRTGLAERIRDHSVVESLSGLSQPFLVHQSNGPLWRVHSGKLTALTNPGDAAPAPPYPNEFFINACASGDGGLWLLTGNRLRRWNRDGSVFDAGPTPWGDIPISRMVESRRGQLWVGTQERGLFMRQPDGAYLHFSRSNSLRSDWVRSIWEDREGTIWVGTGGGGLTALRPRRVQMVQAPDEWQGRGILSVTPSPDGSLWLGTEGAGLYRWAQGQFERFGQDQGLMNSYVWSVLDDGSGPAWAGTWGRGLFQRQDNRWIPVPRLGIEGFVITALYRSMSGDRWVGTQRGLARVHGDQINWIGEKLVSPEVRCVGETPDGDVWFGMSGGGLGRCHNGTTTQFRKADGLPSDDVWSLLPQKDNSIWIGTVGGGLCRWRDGHFVSLNESNGLPSDVICQIVDDGRGNLWLGSRGGIARAARQDIEACADGRRSTVPFFTLGKSDGLATLECSGGAQPSYCRTPDGRLCFPTARGLAVVNPAALTTNQLAPPVLIESMSINGVPVAPRHTKTSRVEVPPGRQRVEFRFTALTYIAPERVHFRYRLDNLDEEWTEAGIQRTVSYNLLPPGTYAFRVIACNSDGIWNREGDVIHFEVQPHPWETWWFRTIASLAGAIAVGVTVRLVTRRRYRQKLERIERQRAVERERSRIARDIHDDLGASLTRITLLSQTASEDLDDKVVAAEHLQSIYGTARELTKAMEEIVWAVNPRHDTLDSLVTYLGRFAQDLASVAGLRCRIDIPAVLPAWPLTAEIRHNVFLAFKEALNNVIRHATAREIRIALQMDSPLITLVVEDDGRGFAPAPPDATSGGAPSLSTRGGTGGGNGLGNMRRRLEEIGGRCEIDSRPGHGTRVRLLIPVKVELASRL